MSQDSAHLYGTSPSEESNPQSGPKYGDAGHVTFKILVKERARCIYCAIKITYFFWVIRLTVYLLTLRH